MRCLICKKAMGSVFKKPVPAIERFIKKVRVTRKCWLWNGSRDRKGYGKISMHRGHVEKAHRLSFVLSGGRITKKAHVLHSCDNPPCVRPSHLFRGNHLINMRDMFSKGRRVAAIGGRHGKAKLTVQDVRRIRAMYADGKGSIVTISALLKIKPSTVRGVLVGRQWKWLKCPKKIFAKVKHRLDGHHAWSFRGK